MTEKEAAKAVDLILADLQDRGGFGDVWDGIDDGVRDEIRSKWVRIVKQASELPT